MNGETLIRLAATAMVLPGLWLVSGCESSNNGNPVSQAPTATTFARQQINSSTDETSAPIQLNDLPLSTADTTETALPRSP